MRNLLKEYYDGIDRLFPEFGGCSILVKETDLFPWFFFDESKLRDYLVHVHKPALEALSNIKIRTVDEQRLYDILHAYKIWNESDFFKLSPFTTMYRPAFKVLKLIDDPRLPSGEKFRAARLKLVANQLEEYLEKMRRGANQNWTLPAVICSQLVKWLEREEIKVASPASPDVLSEAKRVRIQLDRLREWMRDHYQRLCKTSIGFGEEVFRDCMQMFCGVGVDPLELFDRATTRVMDLKQSIQKLLPRGKTLRQFKKSRLLPPSKVLSSFRQAQKSARSMIGMNFFERTAIPSYDMKTSFSHSQEGVAFCLQATPSDPKNQVIIDPTDSVADFEVTPLVLHEGDPGHAFQAQYMLDSGCHWWQVNWSMFTGFVEGWALYAESLGRYQSAADEVGQLSMELWRAARVVVDIGIHCLDWTQKQAEWFLYQNSLLDKKRVQKEILRYISMPGQATTYWFGMQWIKGLREKFSGGDLREFHHKILSNGVMGLGSLELLFENKLLPNSK
jgi:uncharacterized protein (DUF885 family)